MRVPMHWCSVVLLATAGPLLAQGFPDGGSPVTLSLTPTLPDVRPPSAPPTLSSLGPVPPPYPDAAFAADARVVAETSFAWDAYARPGQLTVGAWSDASPDVPAFPGGSRPVTWGKYLVLDQMLWRTNPADPGVPRGLGLYLVYDHVNTDLFPTTEHLSVGLSFQGLFAGAAHDLLGIGLSYAHLAGDPAANFTKDSETAVEVFYRFRLAAHLTLRPEVRFVLDPGTEETEDAVVASVRLEFEY